MDKTLISYLKFFCGAGLPSQPVIEMKNQLVPKIACKKTVNHPNLI
jgi:hypothetical protein